MAYRDDQEPGPRWQHPLGGWSTERSYGEDDMHTPRDYNRGGEYADYGRGGAYGGLRTSGMGGYGTSGSYGDYRTGGSLRGYSGPSSGLPGTYGRDLGQFVSNGHPPSQWWGGSGPHAGKGPRDYHPTDGRIEDEACDLLTRHGHVDASGIRVLVRNGEITLEGTVGSRREKREAEDAVESIPGVRDVHNRLRVSTPRP